VTGALTGWRVLEVANGVAASFCAKILADLGADVLKVEPPGADRSAGGGPVRSGAATGEPGVRFQYLNTSKQSVVVGSGPDEDRRLRDLVSEADVVVTDSSREGLERLGDLPETVVFVSIRPFGSTGPYAAYRAHHLTVFHAGGEGSILPSGPGLKQFPDRPPIQLGGEIAYFDAGWNAAVAALAACYDRLRTDRAQRVDVSVQESELTLNRTRMSRYNNDGVVLHREASRYGITGMMRCSDGWVQLVGIRDEHWDRLVSSPDAGRLADARFATAEGRDREVEALGATLAAWCAERTKAEVVAVLAPIGCSVGAYAVPGDLLGSAQLRHREFLREVDDGHGATLIVPGAPYRFSATPVQVRSAPRLGSSTGFSAQAQDRPKLPAGRLLEGVRVLDFTWAAAGPYATLLLALLGAEVVKVETSRRPDPSRRGFLADYGGINRSPNFNELNLNKRAIQVDLGRPEGLELVRRLIGMVDVVVDNFRPGVMARFGFGASELLEAHPSLIVASSSANGSTGPDAMAAGLASIFGATGGLGEQTGYDDGPPTEVGESTDYRSANALAVAILAALLHRARTGEGQHLDVASREVVAASTPDGLLSLGVDGAWPLRVGNRDRVMAPHDVYPCRGPDEWVAVAVGDEDEWAGLCNLLGRPEWVKELATPAERRASSTMVGEAISEWTRVRAPSEAFEELQSAGVASAPVMTNKALASDPHLAARGVFVEVDHPEIGRTRVMRAPWMFSDSSCDIRRHGPLLGQDNRYVLEGLLGMPPDWPTTLADVLV
jgi:crotonobetainyl-CoA:carnitine CoA-transferase CaiB-like acyl-CoA transferase